MSDDVQAQAAAYVPWKTFKSAIDGFAEVLPNRIDRSAFPTLSGAVQNQLFACLKFLLLVDSNDKPTDQLKALASAKEGERKMVLGSIIRDRYADLFALDLMKTTPNELAETMGASYSVQGDTRKKAVRFFLSALAYLEIPYSPLLTKQERAKSNGTSPARTRRVQKPSRPKPPRTPVGQSADPSPENQKTVQLRSGGSVTLAVNFDPFTVSDSDQKFVMGLIQQFREYAGDGGAE